MGGFSDSTNIVSDPILTVLTTVGLDHEAFLGDTLDKICYQKSGIIKPRSLVVIGPTVNENIVRQRMIGIGNDPGKN